MCARTHVQRFRPHGGRHAEQWRDFRHGIADPLHHRRRVPYALHRLEAASLHLRPILEPGEQPFPALSVVQREERLEDGAGDVLRHRAQT